MDTHSHIQFGSLNPLSEPSHNTPEVSPSHDISSATNTSADDSTSASHNLDPASVPIEKTDLPTSIISPIPPPLPHGHPMQTRSKSGANPQAISKLIKELHTKFALKSLGSVSYFLGFEAYRNHSGIYLTQSKYATDLLHKVNFEDAKECDTPMVLANKFCQNDSPIFDKPELYRSTMGALQYLTLTRPDIAYSVNKLSQHLKSPTINHWNACKRILRYVKGTPHLSLHFRPSTLLNLEGYSDADWPASLDDRKSTSGYCIFLGGNLINWSSRKQKVVARSLTESEYRALASAATELVWINSLMSELGLTLHKTPPVLWCDNQSAQSLALNPIFHTRTKHIELDVHYIRDQISQNKLQVCYIPTEDQTADLFTKPLSSPRFQFLSLMARRFNSPNMVSEQWPPLMANVASSGPGTAANGGTTINNGGNQTSTQNRSRNRDQDENSPVYFNHSIFVKLNDHNFLLWKQQNLHKGSMTLNEYLLKVKQTVDLLASVGETLNDRNHISAIFKGLPVEYDTFIISTNTRIEGYIVAEIEALLLASESRIKKIDQEHEMSVNLAKTEVDHAFDLDLSLEANIAQFNRNMRYPMPIRNNFNNSRGGYIGNNTRDARNKSYQPNQNSRGNTFTGRGGRFPAPPSRIQSSGSTQQNQPQANFVQNTVSQDTNWYPDSGAMNHCTPDAQNLINRCNYNGPDDIYVGDGTGLPIHHTGHSCFLSKSNHILVLNNLLHVPKITKNLLSVSKFGRYNHVYFEFYPDFCHVKDQVTHKILLTGADKNGLYSFDDSQFQLQPFPLSFSPSFRPDSEAKVNSEIVQANVSFAANTECSQNNNNLFQMWHNRLGHPREKIVKTVLNTCNITVSNKIPFSPCNACCLGKIHKFPFPKASETVYNEPLQLVVTDLWGPSHITSTNGYKYYIHFLDAYTRFTWIYLLKNKYDALKTFQLFKAEAKLQLGKKKLRHPYPTTHEQNGLDERKHKHIVENGLTLLAQASMPLKFWDEAFRTVVYIHNRLPTAVLNNQSPIELLFNIKPDYTTFKTFGCQCFPNIRPYNKHKLQFKSSPCTFIGYSTNHKGFKCLDSNGRIYISRDVIFDKLVFPYAKYEFNSSEPPIEYSPSALIPIGNHSEHSPTQFSNNDSPPSLPTQSRISISPGFQSSISVQPGLQSEPTPQPDSTDPHTNSPSDPHVSIIPAPVAIPPINLVVPNHSMFILHNTSSTTLVLVYVDDILVTGSDPKSVASLITSLNNTFSLKDLGELKYFLGIEVAKTKSGLFLSQAKYAKDLLVRADMHDAKSISTPMTTVLGEATTEDVEGEVEGGSKGRVFAWTLGEGILEVSYLGEPTIVESNGSWVRIMATEVVVSIDRGSGCYASLVGMSGLVGVVPPLLGRISLGKAIHRQEHDRLKRMKILVEWHAYYLGRVTLMLKHTE
uniref:Polyprotein n=1 Tax=Cannabis sativa TaxID=3483 RepID=A0A803NJ32_CANSA